MLELGVPFSDPTADGPGHRRRELSRDPPGRLAARRARASPKSCASAATAPLVLFTYYNPVLAFGEASARGAAERAGVDGLLLVDLPPEEGADVPAAATRSGSP